MKAAGRSFLPRESRLQFPESLPSARSRRPDPSIAHLLTTLADDLIVCTGGSMRRALAAFSKADPERQFSLCPEDFLAVMRRLGVSINANQIGNVSQAFSFAAYSRSRSLQQHPRPCKTCARARAHTIDRLVPG